MVLTCWTTLSGAAWRAGENADLDHEARVRPQRLPLPTVSIVQHIPACSSPPHTVCQVSVQPRWCRARLHLWSCPGFPLSWSSVVPPVSWHVGLHWMCVHECGWVGALVFFFFLHIPVMKLLHIHRWKHIHIYRTKKIVKFKSACTDSMDWTHNINIASVHMMSHWVHIGSASLNRVCASSQLLNLRKRQT